MKILVILTFVMAFQAHDAPPLEKKEIEKERLERAVAEAEKEGKRESCTGRCPLQPGIVLR